MPDHLDKAPGLNKRQGGIALLSALAFILIGIFPPITIERRMNGFSDGTYNYELVAREFGGWGFIGQSDIVFMEEPPYRPTDPDNLTLWDRLNMIEEPTDLEEFRKGTKKIAYPVLGMEFGGLLIIAGIALFATRTRKVGVANSGNGSRKEPVNN